MDTETKGLLVYVNEMKCIGCKQKLIGEDKQPLEPKEYRTGELYVKCPSCGANNTLRALGLEEDKKCPLCGEEVPVDDFDQHYKSKECYSNAEGIPLGLERIRLIESGKYPERVPCVFCREEIKEGDEAILISYPDSRDFDYFHASHLEKGFKEMAMAKALKE